MSFVIWQITQTSIIRSYQLTFINYLFISNLIQPFFIFMKLKVNFWHRKLIINSHVQSFVYSRIGSSVTLVWIVWCQFYLIGPVMYRLFSYKYLFPITSFMLIFHFSFVTHVFTRSKMKILFSYQFKEDTTGKQSVFEQQRCHT